MNVPPNNFLAILKSAEVVAATGSTRESTAPPAATTTTMTTTTTSTHPPPPSTTWVQSSLQRVLGRGIQNKIVLHNQHKVTLRVCCDHHNHAEDVSVSLLPGAKSPHPWHCQCGIHGHNFRVTFVTNITPFRRGGFYTHAISTDYYLSRYLLVDYHSLLLKIRHKQIDK